MAYCESECVLRGGKGATVPHDEWSKSLLQSDIRIMKTTTDRTIDGHSHVKTTTKWSPFCHYVDCGKFMRPEEWLSMNLVNAGPAMAFLRCGAKPSPEWNRLLDHVTGGKFHGFFFLFFFFRRLWQSHCTNETVTAISAVKGATEKVCGALWGPNLSSDTPVLPCKHPNEMMSGDIFQCIFLIKKICILM